jgi:hypothetical protein
MTIVEVFHLKTHNAFRLLHRLGIETDARLDPPMTASRNQGDTTHAIFLFAISRTHHNQMLSKGNRIPSRQVTVVEPLQRRSCLDTVDPVIVRCVYLFKM